VSSSPTEPTGTAVAVEVTMPQMGVSVAEGTVVIWHKQPGDWVNLDETICEITTDKIDSDVPSPAAGRLLEILVEPDQTVPVGTALARIETDAVAGEPHPDEHLGDGSPPTEDGALPAEPAETADTAATAATAATAEPARPAGSHRYHSPVVQRIAQREGIDLERVPGSGRGGRVRKQDVMAFLRAQGNGHAAGAAAEPPEAPPQPPSAPPPEAPMHIESPYREDPDSASPAAPASNGAGGVASERDPGEGERLSRMRRSIGAHMVESLRTAAHCTSIAEADMSRIEAARGALGMTYLPFVARCVIDALRAHPNLNATLEGETLTRHTSVHLGIAVSLREEGLIVPVIHDAQDLSHEGLATRIAELARRARAGELSADDVRGGTFTITNPGGYGTLASTPIINQPQVAILDLEAVVKRPVVLTDEQGRDSLAIRPITNLCLSWDHRALDGALAAQFLGTIRTRIENWGNV
jgi:pyruvate/2-oxoglutarate dehydrogenase complex dihydrolipoamide acyltransferase (E2) component